MAKRSASISLSLLLFLALFGALMCLLSHGLAGVSASTFFSPPGNEDITATIHVYLPRVGSPPAKVGFASASGNMVTVTQVITSYPKYWMYR